MNFPSETIQLTDSQSIQLLEKKENTFLALLLLIWETGVTAPLLLQLVALIARHALKAKDLQLKKMTLIWTDLIENVRNQMPAEDYVK